MKKTAIVILSNSAEFMQIDTVTLGQLTRGAADLELGKGITITCPHNLHAHFVRVENRKIETAVDACTFGAEMYQLFKSDADILQFMVDTSHNNDIEEGAHLAKYQFLTYKTDAKLHRLQEVQIATVGNTSIAASINFARDVITEPGNILFPAEYANRINETLSPLGVTVKVYPQSQLQDMGFNLLLSVGQGSSRDSYVVVMEWLNGESGEPVTALVGKGVTFDSGGISLKPGKGMGDMKYDMGGSAAVFGAMHAIANHNVKCNVVGIVGLVENMPDGGAIKPGDIVTSLNGLTVENLNTDAEGRLVLADILTHVQTYNPATIVDLATLTGTIVASLGHEMAGLFTNSTELEKQIIAAGKTSGEGFWRMPMGTKWNKMIDSDIADIKNIGGSYGGATTAAEFLYRFVDEDRAWAHLDIAGMAWEESGTAMTPKGAVGFGVRTLFNLISAGKLSGLVIDEDMKY
jgi:leucyl aminopeptidase